jgi:hypothetical protein
MIFSSEIRWLGRCWFDNQDWFVRRSEIRRTTKWLWHIFPF